MADNINDDTLENPINMQSEKLSEKIISPNGTDSIIPKQETENMEVHHHPDLHHKPKKWKEYFLEFLMIFLAVSMGFFAESYREGLNDHTKEKEFMVSIIEDLKSDTVTYADYAKNNAEVFAIIDSLTTLMKSSERDTHINKIYFLARTLTLKFLLHYATTRTYDQMKSSGQLRIIHKTQVANGIGSYYSSLAIMNSFNDVLLTHDYAYMRTMGKIFDAEILINILKERKEPSMKSIKLITEDPLTINELLTEAQYLYGSLRLSQNITTLRQRSAENLITLISTEYHIK
jgi:hypothetical protein